MFEKNSMLSFSNLDSFRAFYNQLEIYNNWQIQSGLLNDRGKEITGKPYTVKLRELFTKKNLFRRNVSVAEIVSWLDSYVIIQRVCDELLTMITREEYDRIELYSEYKIAMSKNRRIDFVFQYDNRVLLVEFRLSETFPNVSSMWNKKELELIVYKELLQNYLSPTMTILVFAFIGMPEFDNQRPIKKNIKYNSENINFFARYITFFLVRNKDINVEMERCL